MLCETTITHSIREGLDAKIYIPISKYILGFTLAGVYAWLNAKVTWKRKIYFILSKDNMSDKQDSRFILSLN